MTTLTGHETLLVVGLVSTNSPAATAFQCSTQDIANLGGGSSASAVNVFTPEQFGAQADAVGQNDGVVSGAGLNQFSSPTHVFTSSSVGKFLWFDTTDRIITAVNAGVATFTPASAYSATGLLWLSGTDDTVAIQAALDAAKNVQGTDTAETSGGTDGLINSGGTCQLAAGKAYILID